MITLTVYGGCGTVGGNKVLLEDADRDTRLFFDFGTDYARRGLYFEEFLRPRALTGVVDLLVTGVLPPIEGIYRDDFFPEGWTQQTLHDYPHHRTLERLDGVLLSHAHLDHCGAVSFLRPETPVFVSAMTGVVAKAVQDTSSGDTLESEFVYTVPRELTAAGLLGIVRSAAFTPRPYTFVDPEPVPESVATFWSERPRKMRELTALMQTGFQGQVGGCPVRPFPVDHSVFGATAWAVETSAGWVVYTGDLRFHGARAEQSERFEEEIAALRPRVLICEGTRIGEAGAREGRAVSEADVLERALAEVRAAPGLVVADFGPRNIERLMTFVEVARQSGRRLAVLAKDAYLLRAMAFVGKDVPTVETCEELVLWDDPKGTRFHWEQQVRYSAGRKIAGAKQIRASQGDYILAMSFWDVKNLIDLQPRNGLYLYSSSEVYDEEGAADMRRLHNWLRLFEMRQAGLPIESDERDEYGRAVWKIPEDQRGLHASGHASGEQLLDLIRRVRPKAVVPIHTELPEAFRMLEREGLDVLVPNYGEAIVLA
jgi:ribonuclease J